MPLKQQSAVEFIVTYSWAILAISIFVVSVIVLSGAKPQQDYLQSTCNIQPLLPCEDALLTYGTGGNIQYYLVFTNQLGALIYFPPNAITANLADVGSSGTPTGVGECTPILASAGAPILCNVSIRSSFNPAPGSQQIVNFAIRYGICTPSSSCLNANYIYSNAIPSNYISSGYSMQDVAPAGIKLNRVLFTAEPDYGTIVLGGVTYFNGTVVYLPTGNYIAYALPSQGYAFESWSGNGIDNPSSQNTTLTLDSDTNIIAQFGSG